MIITVIITCLYCWRNSALGSLIFGNSQNTIQKLEMNFKKILKQLNHLNNNK